MIFFMCHASNIIDYERTACLKTGLLRELVEDVEYSDAGPGFVSTSPWFIIDNDKNVRSSKLVKQSKSLIFL